MESGGPEAVLDDQGAGLGMVTVALLELEGLGAERKEGCQGDEGLALARLYPKAEFWRSRTLCLVPGSDEVIVATNSSPPTGPPDPQALMDLIDERHGGV